MRRKKLEFGISIAMYLATAVLSGVISITILNQHHKLTHEFLAGNTFITALLPLILAEVITMVLTLYDGKYSFHRTTIFQCLLRSIYSTIIFAGALAAILIIQKNSITDSRFYFVGTITTHFVLLAIFLYGVQTYTVSHFYNTRAASLVLLVTTRARAAETSAILKRDWSRKLSGIALLDEEGSSSSEKALTMDAVSEAVPEKAVRNADVDSDVSPAKAHDVEQNPVMIDHVPVVAGRDSFVTFVQLHAIDEVFLIADDNETPDITSALREFIQMGVAVHLNLPFIEHLDTSLRLKDDKYIPRTEKDLSFFMDNWLPLINLSQPEPKMRWMAAKRVLDICGGIVGMAITVVLFVVLGIAIKLDSPGPVLFAQTRIGKNGRRFKMYKFRSMYRDAEARKAALMQQNEMNGLMFKMKDDPRITRVGKFIRKTSLDEFPQFFNVLKGDMSLVGTRPPTESEFQQYSNYHRRRLSMKPGITGLWQVSGRSEITDFEDVVRLDCKYIDEWSFWKDIKILWKTVIMVIKRKGSE